MNRTSVGMLFVIASSLTTFLLLAGCANSPHQEISRRDGPPRHSPPLPQNPASQTSSGGSDTYEVDFIGADLLESPSATSPHTADIPEGTILIPLAKELYFIKVNYAGKTGWVSIAGLKRHMAVPSADIEFLHHGYKIVNGRYRYFFGLNNEGVQPYVGDITVRLYAGEAEVPVRAMGFVASGTGEHEYTPGDLTPTGYPIYVANVIPPAQGIGYYLDADTLATRYVFQTKQGKRMGRVGERLQN